MPDSSELIDILLDVVQALQRIERRSAQIHSPQDFILGEEGRMYIDSICMLLLAVGEAFKRVDRKTQGTLLSRYPGIDWPGVKGVRDVLAHAYFDVDEEAVFAICRRDIPALIPVVRQIIDDLLDPSTGL